MLLHLPVRPFYFRCICTSFGLCVLCLSCVCRAVCFALFGGPFALFSGLPFYFIGFRVRSMTFPSARRVVGDVKAYPYLPPSCFPLSSSPIPFPSLPYPLSVRISLRFPLPFPFSFLTPFPFRFPSTPLLLPLPDPFRSLPFTC